MDSREFRQLANPYMEAKIKHLRSSGAILIAMNEMDGHLLSAFDEEKPTTEEEALKLIQRVLEQFPVYGTKEYWGKAEAEAEEDIKNGRVKSFSNIEDLLTDLEKEK